MQDPTLDTPTRPVRLGSTEADVERCADGSLRMRLREPLGTYPRRYTDTLVRWAREAPERVFLARRPPQGPVAGVWQTLSYAQAHEQVRAVGQALLDRGLGPREPVFILSENDVENQLLALACTHVGVPYVPVTPAYSLLSKDHAKLRSLAARCRPKLVFASSAAQYGAAVAAAFPKAEFVATEVHGRHATPFSELLRVRPDPAVDAAFDAITPDTVSKVLFTSGTTGDPKGVMLTHRMLCSNRQQCVQAWPFLQDEPPVLVDWLPWHHTFGGTNNVGLALYCGGSYYLDPGKPMPGAVQPTVDALREISPTIYFNSPGGLAALLPHLRSDAALRRNFFSRLQLLYYGGAVLPKPVWAGFDELALAETGQRILIASGLGSTECGPVPATNNRDPRREPMVGLPVAGVELKLVPVNDKLEIRVKGPCVTPGYWGEPERTHQAFDDEGYFCMGDAVLPVDPAHPEHGLRFDGRIGENFKLVTGTWVHAGPLRERTVAAFAPLVSDAVLAGEGQAQVGALLFPDLGACRALDRSLPAGADAQTVLANPSVRAAFQQRLDALAAEGTGSASRVLRVRLETEPATLDSGEMTAKAALSMATVLRRRAAAVQALHGDGDGYVLCAAS
jgi:feruloyl-CoA synthase